MKKLVWISDTHLDLTTDGIDRNPEIEKVIMHAVDHAIKIKAKYFVFGGDLADGAELSDDAFSIIIRAFNKLNKAKIITWVMDGNHEKKSRGKMSCLHFVEDLRKTYKYLRWVPDIKGVRVLKDTYFVFFPHVNKAMIPKEFKTPQDYVEHWGDRFIKKIDFFSQVFVFSHLNVRGVIPGSEEHMLKKSEVYLPDHFHHKNYLDKPFPTVLNGHIHSYQKSGWANIIGSPIFVSFGEKEKKKYFAEVDIATKRNELNQIHLRETPCRKFHQFDLPIKDPNRFPEVMGAFASAFKSVGKEDIVKIVPTIHGDLDVDWEVIRKEFMKQCFYIKPIHPSFVKKRVKRNAKQKLDLNPKDAVKVYIESNKPKFPKTVARLANNYIEGVL